MMSFPDFYGDLNLPRDATSEEIAIGFNLVMDPYWAAEAVGDTEEMALLEPQRDRTLQAYKTLSDPELRALYDDHLHADPTVYPPKSRQREASPPENPYTKPRPPWGWLELQLQQLRQIIVWRFRMEELFKHLLLPLLALGVVAHLVEVSAAGDSTIKELVIAVLAVGAFSAAMGLGAAILQLRRVKPPARVGAAAVPLLVGGTVLGALTGAAATAAGAALVFAVKALVFAVMAAVAIVITVIIGAFVIIIISAVLAAEEEQT